jgi:hypothetical protein
MSLHLALFSLFGEAAQRYNGARRKEPGRGAQSRPQ